MSLLIIVGEVTLNFKIAEGDQLIERMRKEVDCLPGIIRSEVSLQWSQLNGDWTNFKISCKTNPGLIIGGPSLPGSAEDFERNLKVAKGIQVLERTGESLMRAQKVAKESEQIGSDVINELGEQRETLIRARERLDETNHHLKTTHRVLRSINRRVITNKCLLIAIIFLETAILICLIYWKFIMRR